jgi:hypothetical protein
MSLAKRTARLIREKETELSNLRFEIARLKISLTLKPATMYALDFANPGEATIIREELEHDITEDIGALEAEDGQAARMIEEAVAAGELELSTHVSGSPAVYIPFKTWRKAGYQV